MKDIICIKNRIGEWINEHKNETDITGRIDFDYNNKYAFIFINKPAASEFLTVKVSTEGIEYFFEYNYKKYPDFDMYQLIPK